MCVAGSGSRCGVLCDYRCPTNAARGARIEIYITLCCVDKAPRAGVPLGHLVCLSMWNPRCIQVEESRRVRCARDCVPLAESIGDGHRRD